MPPPADSLLFFSGDDYLARIIITLHRRRTHGPARDHEPAGAPEDHDRIVDGMGCCWKSAGPDRTWTRVGRGSDGPHQLRGDHAHERGAHDCAARQVG